MTRKRQMAVATDYHLFWKGDLMVLEWKIAAFILLTSSPDFRLFRDSILCRAESFIEHELSTVLGLRESVKQAQLFSGAPSCLSQMFLKSAVCLPAMLNFTCSWWKLPSLPKRQILERKFNNEGDRRKKGRGGGGRVEACQSSQSVSTEKRNVFQRIKWRAIQKVHGINL